MQATTRARGRFFVAATVLAIAGALSGCAPFAIESSMPSFTGFGGGGAQPAAGIEQVFVASTRRGENGAAAEKASTDGVHFTLATIGVPPNHKSGVIEKPMWGSPKPDHDFVLTGLRELDGEEFRNELAAHISGRIGVNRDVLLYVHGFNTSLDDARFTAAQVASDARFGGVPLLFTWASASKLFSYESDKDAATASRDALQELLTELSRTPGVGKIHVLAHSMGAWLAMEALRQEAIAGDRDLGGHLGDVMLASPDLDMDVFASQMAKLRPAHVTVLATSKDRALSMSSVIADSRRRVGAIDPNNVEDRRKIQSLGAQVYDLTNYAKGFIDHNIYSSAPEVLASIGSAISAPRVDESGKMSILDATNYPDASSPPPAPVVAPAPTPPIAN